MGDNWAGQQRATAPAAWTSLEQLRTAALSHGCSSTLFDHAVAVMGPDPNHVVIYLHGYTQLPVMSEQAGAAQAAAFGRENIDAWLNPDPKNVAALYLIVGDHERPHYEHRIAAQCCQSAHPLLAACSDEKQENVMLVLSRPLRRNSRWILVQASLVPFFIMSAGHAGSLPATASAVFSPATVMVGGTQTTAYTLTVSNPNATDLTNVQFTNAYPAGLVADVVGNYTCATSNVLNPPGNPGGTNGGSANFTGTGFSFTLNTLSAGDSCTVVVNMHATSQGSLVDTTSTFTSTEASAGAAASATLMVNPSTPVTLQAFDVE